MQGAGCSWAVCLVPSWAVAPGPWVATCMINTRNPKASPENGRGKPVRLGCNGVGIKTARPEDALDWAEDSFRR